MSTANLFPEKAPSIEAILGPWRQVCGLPQRKFLPVLRKESPPEDVTEWALFLVFYTATSETFTKNPTETIWRDIPKLDQARTLQYYPVLRRAWEADAPQRLPPGVSMLEALLNPSKSGNYLTASDYDKATAFLTKLAKTYTIERLQAAHSKAPHNC